MSIFYASHEEDITIARASVLEQITQDQAEVHQIVYNYDLNRLFDSLFTTITPNVDGSDPPVPSVTSGVDIDDAVVLAVHDILKSEWAGNAGFVQHVRNGLEKLFQRFTTYPDADDTTNDAENPVDDGNLSSNIRISTTMVQGVLSDVTSELSLNMMSQSQIKSIAQSLIDLHKYAFVDGAYKLNLVENDRVVSYSNVIDSDNITNKDKWEIVLNHTPTATGPTPLVGTLSIPIVEEVISEYGKEFSVTAVVTEVPPMEGMPPMPGMIPELNRDIEVTMYNGTARTTGQLFNDASGTQVMLSYSPSGQFSFQYKPGMTWTTAVTWNITPLNTVGTYEFEFKIPSA